MKNSLLILFVFSFCALQVVAQTNATVPGPEHVLVVYKLPDPNNPADTISRAVMRYYQQIRGIPEKNIVGLTNFPSYDILPSGIATIESDGEIIKSSGNKAAWEYYKKYIADKIELYLTNTYVDGVQLKNIIRYIVL